MAETLPFPTPTLADWKVAHAAEITLTADGHLAYADAEETTYHLIRVRDPAYVNQRLLLRLRARPQSTCETELYVAHWGGIDVCRIAANGVAVGKPACERLEIRRGADGWLDIDVTFYNAHESVSLGTSLGPCGRYTGFGAPQYVFASIELTLAPPASVGSLGEVAQPRPAADPSISEQATILRLLRSMRPMDCDIPKIRLGAEHDGGYVLNDVIADIDNVVSIGIGGEVSFDLQLAIMGKRIFQYDHTVAQPPFAHPNFTFRKKGWGAQDTEQFTSLGRMLEENGIGDSDRNLLKFDVEGAEWPILLELDPDILQRFRVITVELHSFSRLADPVVRAQIEHGFAKLTRHHAVTHLHPNNATGIAIVHNIPIPPLIEFSFLRRDLAAFRPSFDPIPGKLDFPCNPHEPEIVLTPFA